MKLPKLPFPYMYLHGDMEQLQHKIIRYWTNPNITSGYEVRRLWRQIQKDMNQNIKDMDRIPRDAVRNQEGPW